MSEQICAGLKEHAKAVDDAMEEAKWMEPPRFTMLKVTQTLIQAYENAAHYCVVVDAALNTDNQINPSPRWNKDQLDAVPLDLDPNYLDGTAKPWTFSLRIWLMSSHVTFDPIAKETHSIILTSGTLSPLTGMKAELGEAFSERLPPKLVFEANHCIDKKLQLWVGCVSVGPTGKTMLGTHQGQSNGEWAHEVGRSILEISRVTPHGVLVFLPSYGSLAKLTKIWEESGLWAELEAVKPEVIAEPSEGGQQAFNEARDEYRAAIDRGTGALLFAVFRGKMSEGISFNDNYSRSVVLVGIPFPNIKDIRVGCKREYNTERNKREEGIIRGDIWYSQQAYRALNQAMGRCIRHRNDFGSIIFLDSRFVQEKQTSQLSKWLRNDVKRPQSFAEATRSMTEFFSVAMKEPRLALKLESVTGELDQGVGVKKTQLKEKVEISFPGFSSAASFASADSLPNRRGHHTEKKPLVAAGAYGAMMRGMAMAREERQVMSSVTLLKSVADNRELHMRSANYASHTPSPKQTPLVEPLCNSAGTITDPVCLSDSDGENDKKASSSDTPSKRSPKRPRSDQECRICFAEVDEFKHVFVPCGHRILCENCAKNFEPSSNEPNKECPICRKGISMVMKTFTA